METNTPMLWPRAALVQSQHLRQGTAVWVRRARAVRQESRRLRQHARALRARCQHWHQRYLLVACGWCEKHLSWQYLDKPLTLPVVTQPATSHGICPACYVTVARELGLRQSRASLG
jgi:hypothetical protein